MSRLLLAAFWLGLGMSACSSEPVYRADEAFCNALHTPKDGPLSKSLAPWASRMNTQTGVYVLERGNDALLARAFLCDSAERSIDIQYFIFSADNVGLIASDYLLRAAERGVRVRILVDDMLVDADAEELLAYDAHPNLEVRIYNPNVNLGKSWLNKLENAVSDFRAVNQRMHNKTFIVDGKVVITGGRNVADEYFDYDQEYSFRDRDVLLLGAVSRDIASSFERFWGDPLSQPISKVVAHEARLDPKAVWKALHDYACDPSNFWPQVRDEIESVPEGFRHLEAKQAVHWTDQIRFISDMPGKNDGKQGLGGGGITTSALLELIRNAKRSVWIQSPYLVTTEQSRALFADAVKRGVKVTILSNSLSSTDNLPAFSGYARHRKELLETGVNVYEWKPDAKVRRAAMGSTLEEVTGHVPVFGLHAKTMVIDEETLVVGTFNLDPRSTNLNTECITVVSSKPLAEGVLQHMREEIRAENAWHTTARYNPDAEAGPWKQIKLWLHGIVPIEIL